MKKLSFVFLLQLLCSVGFGQQQSSTQDTERLSVNSYQLSGTVTFQDPGLERAVTQCLKMKSAKDVNICEIETLEVWEGNISSLCGIEKLTRLKRLQIIEKGVTDISMLADLKNLKILRLEGNKIEDINALATLSELQELQLDCNRIKDLQPLTKLTKLRVLSIVRNPLSEKSYNIDIPLIKVNNPGIGLYTDRSFYPLKALAWTNRVILCLLILFSIVPVLLIHIFVQIRLTAHFTAPLASLCTFIMIYYFFFGKNHFIITALPVALLLSVIISLITGFGVGHIRGRIKGVR